MTDSTKNPQRPDAGSPRQASRAPRPPREIQLNSNYRAPAGSVAGGRATPVFLIHDGFGEILHYRKLAEKLSPQVPVYALPPRPVGDLVMAHTRIEDMAAAYVERIKRVQPEGPYRLGGLCAGGVIAFEMAKQLQREGAKIDMLALLDCSLHGEPMRVGRFALRWIDDLKASLRSHFARPNPLQWLAGVAGFAAGFTRLVFRQAVAQLHRSIVHLKVRSLRRALNQGRRPPAFARTLSVNEIYMTSLSDPANEAHFEGDVTLYRASNGSADFGDEPFRNLFADPLLGWGRRVDGTVRCVDIGGGHYSMLGEPHVDALAADIQRHLDALPES